MRSGTVQSRVRAHSTFTIPIQIMDIKILSISLALTFLFAACQQNSPKTPASIPTASAETLPWATDLDLVCEMKVDQTVEDTMHFNGKIYGFCNPNCKEEFQSNPTKYGAK